MQTVRTRRGSAAIVMTLAFTACSGGGSDAGAAGAPGDAGVDGMPDADGSATPVVVRVAQFNIQFLDAPKLENPDQPQVAAAVEVIRRFDPDVVAVNEIAFELTPGEPVPAPGTIVSGNNAGKLAARLAATGVEPYDHSIMVMGNNGFAWDGFDPSLHDPYFARRGLNASPGPLNYAVLSRHPIRVGQVRVVTELAWTDLPGNLIDSLKSASGIDVPPGFPLQSKAIAVVPIDVAGKTLQLVLQHTIPPVFHPVNPYRNHDELTAMRLLIEGKLPGVAPLPAAAAFVLMGDFNADPDHGESLPGAVKQLLEHPSVVAFQPSGAGTVGVSPELNTHASVCGAAGGPDPSGGLQFQLDYLLPSAAIGEPLDGGMFFPDYLTQPADWALACQASDHMMLWADLEL
jgi:hypothetical protein